MSLDFLDDNLTQAEASSSLDLKDLAQHEKALFCYAKHLFYGNAESARDAVQETFYQAIKRPPRVSGEQDSLKAWLFTVCRRIALRAMKKQNRYADDGEEILRETPSPHLDPARQTLKTEAVEEAMHAVESLSTRQQEILRLKFQAGFKYREIAQVLDITESNVGFLLHQAIKLLRDKLRPSGFLDDTIQK